MEITIKIMFLTALAYFTTFVTDSDTVALISFLFAVAGTLALIISLFLR